MDYIQNSISLLFLQNSTNRLLRTILHCHQNVFFVIKHNYITWCHSFFSKMQFQYSNTTTAYIPKMNLLCFVDYFDENLFFRFPTVGKKGFDGIIVMPMVGVSVDYDRHDISNSFLRDNGF